MSVKRLMVIALLFPALAAAGDVQWAPVQTGELLSVLRVPGKVIPREGAVTIESARIQGRVTNIRRREGEVVTAGDALFDVNSPECISLAEEKRVADERGLSELISGARMREEQLGLRVQNGSCQILATRAGTIVKRSVELGSAFNVGDALATVLDVSNLTVELDLPERDLAQVKPRQKVHFQLVSNPDRSRDAEIDRILPSIDPQTRTSRVRLNHVNLPASATLDSLVLAEIDIDGEERILKVPTTALVFNENKQYVVKGGDENPSPVSVEVINETESTSSVRPWKKADLQARDMVAVKGAIFVFNRIKNATVLE